jgi:AcrR family transcriptional regulator
VAVRVSEYLDSGGRNRPPLWALTGLGSGDDHVTFPGQRVAMRSALRANPGEGARLRAEIVDAAAALLIEAGTEQALTLRAVARRAGVTTPSVYLHFADKDALVRAVCLRVWDELGERVQTTAATAAEDPLLALGRSGRVYVRFALDHPIQYRLLMMTPTAADTPPAATAWFQSVMEAVEACVAAGILHGDRANLAVGLWSVVHGLASLLITQTGFPWPDDLDTLVNQTIRMAGYGSVLACRTPLTGVMTGVELAVEVDHFTTPGPPI